MSWEHTSLKLLDASAISAGTNDLAMVRHDFNDEFKAKLTYTSPNLSRKTVCFLVLIKDKMIANMSL